MTTKAMDSDHTMTAVLSYLSFLVFVPMFAVKSRDDFIRFHINQGLTLFIIELILTVAGWFLRMTFFFAWTLSWLLSIVWLAILVVSIIAIIKALQGEKWEIPLLSFRFVDIK
jgi:uncharacterized membrane protein